MRSLSELHDEAMDLTDQAFAARRARESERTVALFRAAFELEKAAADLAFQQSSPEPTLSVLHRSAATLAVDCGEYREAERLIGRALSGDPPGEIAAELRELLNQVYQSWAA